MALAYGDVVTCAIQAFSDTDTFTFAGVTGDVIVISTTFVCFTLAHPSGTAVDVCGVTGRYRLDAVLSESGIYTVTTRLQPVGIINYTLALERLAPASPQSRPMNYGDTLTDTMNVAGDLDVFSFVAAANDAVSIRATSATNQQPCIELVAPDNSRSTACNLLNSNQLQLTLLQAGTYVVLMRQGDNIPFTSAWSYTLELLCAAGACFSAPNPPTGFTGIVSTVATTLMWNAPTTGRPPTSYVIEAGTSAGGTNVMVFDTLSTATTFVAPGIPNGTYFVRVKSRNSVGTSAPSNETAISGSSVCPLPSAPGNFTASAVGSVVSLAWNAAVGDPTSYVLEAGSSAGASNLANIDLGLATQLMTVAPNGTYFLRTRARNACGLGPAGNEITLVVGCAAPPAAPSNLVAMVSGSAVMLSWPAAAGQPTSYSIEAGSAAGLSNLANVDVGNQLTLTANAPPGTYFVRVRAKNACGTSTPTVERTVVVP